MIRIQQRRHEQGKLIYKIWVKSTKRDMHDALVELLLEIWNSSK